MEPVSDAREAFPSSMARVSALSTLSDVSAAASVSAGAVSVDAVSVDAVSVEASAADTSSVETSSAAPSSAAVSCSPSADSFWIA